MKPFVNICYFLLLVNELMAQNYDPHRSMAENPSYILDEYYEIIKNDSGQSEVLHFTKYFFQGSTIERKEYALGTPYYLNLEWHKGTLKMPGQQEVEGFLSYNQAFQRVSFKSAANALKGMSVNPEYFTIGNTTFSRFPDFSIMEFAYFSSVPFEGVPLLCKNGKLQSNDFNLELLDPYNITDKKYTAEFLDTPSYYIIKNDKALKVEDKNYFYKQFGSGKKAMKQYVSHENIDFMSEDDVKKLLTHLLN
jgi:hypothetical protein